MPRLVGYGFPNAPASAVIHSRTDLIIFGDPLWLISFFQICFWCVGFDTLLNLVALNMYGSSRRAIVSMILTPTSIRIHPKAMHPYPLYSIPGMLQQSGRRILHTKCISRSGHGQLQHLLHWPRQGGGHGRWWQMCFIRCAETSWQRLVTEVSDTSLPAFSSIKWSFKNALSL